VLLLNIKAPLVITCSVGAGMIDGVIAVLFPLKHAVNSNNKVVYIVICVVRLKMLICYLIDNRYLANLDKILYLYN